jgi:26S proteasome regulatory subunit T4
MDRATLIANYVQK